MNVNISAVFIERPVMTTLVMLAIMVFGVLGFTQLPINDMPRVDYPTISVSASLPGANPETMASTVATVLERQFSTIAGIDSMNSSSSNGSSSITIQFNLSRDIESAAQDVQTAISAALPLLPAMPSRPFFRKVNPADAPILFLLLNSTTLPLPQVDEYAETLVAQRISMVSGVAQVTVYGSQKYAVRIQLNPEVLASHHIGVDSIQSAVAAGNQKSPTGTLYGPHVQYNVKTNDQLFNAAQYRKLVIAQDNGKPLFLGDVANVLDSVANDKVANWTRNGRGIVLAVQRQPNTNTVQVIDDIRATIPTLQADMPSSVTLGVLFDRSLAIRDSVRDVERTILITIALVVFVIYLFLRNGTATFIPSVALPMSLVGTFAAMALLNFSLDNLSLMGLTLCVGFVVDDAIVVLENIVRHMEMGVDPMTAAHKGTEEVGFTIVSMTISLVAVFIPILFLSGLIGRLFYEFAMTIVVAILISGFVSLSLTPMLCSRFLKVTPHDVEHGWMYNALEHFFEQMLSMYEIMLRWSLRFKPLILLLAFALLGATAWAGMIVSKGFIPTTDSGQISANTEGPQDIGFKSMVAHSKEVADIIEADPNVLDYMSSVGSGGASAGGNAGRLQITLKPLGQRKLKADAIIQELRKKLSKVVGLRVYMTNPPSIKIGGQSTKGLYQVTLQSLDLSKLYSAADLMVNKLKDVPGIQDPNTDIQEASLMANLTVDRDKAASLGLTSRSVDQTLALAYGTSQLTQIFTDTNEYQVIMEVMPQFYQGPQCLQDLYLHTSGGGLIPLAAVAKYSPGVGPLTINHLGELPSATVSFNLKPGTSLGDAVTAIQDMAHQSLPAGVTASFQGNAQAFQATLINMLYLLVVAVLVIYIVLGILYESFAHPITILAGLPSAGLGAILTLMIFHADLDIYGFLGLILLLGIVKKNAIMLIDHALEAQRTKGLPPEQAIYEACLVRFRPIMMTTMAAFMGSVPIAVGLGAGADARRPLGLTVCGGLLFSQLLTLLITPVVYIYIDRYTSGMQLRRGRGGAVSNQAR